MDKESWWRSLLKIFSWRISATLITILLVYIFSGKLAVAFAVGGVEVFAKLFFYFVHERIWNWVKFGRRNFDPFVLWFTGLSGAGKTTLAENVLRKLAAKGIKAELLDGDTVRSAFPQTGFSREERDEHVRRVGFMAGLLEKNGTNVICSFISPFRESRSFVRQTCGKFVEVYVQASLAECEKRDVKGLYEKVRRGEIKDFTGVDSSYEPPERCEVVVDTEKFSVDECAQQIMLYLQTHIF